MFNWYFKGLFDTCYVIIVVNIRNVRENMKALEPQSLNFMNDPRIYTISKLFRI